MIALEYLERIKSIKNVLSHSIQLINIYKKKKHTKCGMINL